LEKVASVFKKTQHLPTTFLKTQFKNSATDSALQSLTAEANARVGS